MLETAMVLTQDYIHHFKGYWNSDSFCRIRIYREVPDGARLVVIITEMIDEDGNYLNSGTSVVNSIEKLATELRGKGIRFTHLIQHLPARGYGLRVRKERGLRPEYPEEFSILQFKFENNRYSHPVWQPTPKLKVEELIGQNLVG